MAKRAGITLYFLVLGIFLHAQVTPDVDTSKSSQELPELDTMDLDYDFLFDEFASFLDSLSKPHSYVLAGVSLGRGYYNYTNKSSVFLESQQQNTYSPTLAYFHKSGLSVTGTGNIVNDGERMNLYQFFVSPSYDYLKNRKLATGIAYTRYFTRDSLPFYTTPLQNEVYAYFTYRKWWLRPSVSVSYGWGSREDYEQRESLINDLRLRARGYVRINTKESVSDFSLVASVRHDFYFLNTLSVKDYVRLSPQINFTSGTQNFGFNQSTNTYATLVRTGTNVLFNSENTYLNDQIRFQPLALTFLLRTEYSIGKFYIQPQLVLDYYFPAEENNFSSLLAFNLGMIF